jgi:hypothetical protein
VVIDPQGKNWVLQPQPTKASHLAHGLNNQIVFGRYDTIEETVQAVTSWYNTAAVWYDVRNSKYERI